MSEGKEAVKEVNTFLDRIRPDLVITDVPKDTLKAFKELGNSDEFKCGHSDKGHYGFLLKFLMDFYLGKLTNGVPELNEEVELINEKLAELSSQPEEKKVIRNVHGDVIHSAM